MIVILFTACDRWWRWWRWWSAGSIAALGVRLRGILGRVGTVSDCFQVGEGREGSML